jgi:hypothetical protein
LGIAAGDLIIRIPATRWWRRAALAALASCCAVAGAMAAEPADPPSARQAICRTINDAAAANGLPFGFLARLLWTESGFQSSVTSPAGAEGIAQFMPQTATERGLADPRDPQEAIHHAARLLVDLDRQFGNLGLAAAAYNAGAARVARWLQGMAALPIETQIYVRAVTGRSAEDWAMARASYFTEASAFPLTGFDCLNATSGPVRRGPVLAPPARIWQVRLDGNLALAIGLLEALTRNNDLPARRPQTPGPSDRAAESLCGALRARGAACAVFGR